MLYSELQTFVQESASFTSSENTTKLVGAGSTGWINQAYFRLVRDTACYQGTFSEALVASQSEYTTAAATGQTDILRILEMRITGNGATSYPLRLVTLDELNDHRVSNQSAGDSAPYVYAMLGLNTMVFYPAPGSSVTLDGSYIKRPAGLSAGTDVPSAVPEEYHLAIAYKALETAMSYDNRPDEAQYWRGLYEADRELLRRNVVLFAGNRRGDMRPSRPAHGFVPYSTWDRTIG